MRARFILRTRVIFALVLLFFLVLAGRLYSVQIVHGERYAELASRQYLRPVRNLYDRGNIFFTDKEGREIAGATVRSGFLVAVNPKKVEDPDALYAALSPLIPLDYESFIARVGKKDDPYEEIAHKVSAETARAIDQMGLEGISLYRERWRYYPGGSLAAHVLGFEAFGEDGETRSGRYGLERYYDDILRREEKKVYVNFFAEVFTGISDRIFDSGKNRAGEVITTLEPSVQAQVEEVLAALQDTWSAKEVGAIVIDPRDGSLIAMASLPSFDLNEFFRADPSVFDNPLVESVFEMGSIMKPITMAIGLDTQAVTPDTTYVDKGAITIDGSTIRNYDNRGRGEVPMQEVLNQSLNTGAAFIVDQVGREEFTRYMLRFGFGEKTGIELPNEVRGLIANLHSPRAVEYATASFGQGIAVTPIAMVRALSALANGGYLITPHLTKEIRYENGGSYKPPLPEPKRVIAADTSEEISRMLTVVVDEALRGGTVAKERYRIAAKTGTAQIARKDARGYYDDRFLHTFFGYFPSFDPQFLVFLYAMEPRGARYASQTLTDPFMDIVNFLINYYEIPPDR